MSPLLRASLSRVADAGSVFSALLLSAIPAPVVPAALPALVQDGIIPDVAVKL
jgi:hypothetical protein